MQRLTTPGAWSPEAVEADSAWNLEANHVISQSRLHCPIGPGGLLDQGPNHVCGLGSQRGNLTGTVPCALNSALRGDHCPAVGSVSGASWDLTLTLPRTGTLHQNLSLPRTLTLHLSRLCVWALTSSVEEDHETGVASALATSLDQTLTLANALSPWGPNSNV